jgi:peptide/nickel transport system ATP-binding protein/oligopeptide transport system ATP-binding protein
MPSALNPPPGCRFHTRCPYAVARCRVERPELEADPMGHATACHRTAELPPTDAVPLDDGLSPTLEKLIAAFGASEEASAPAGVGTVSAGSRRL